MSIRPEADRRQRIDHFIQVCEEAGDFDKQTMVTDESRLKGFAFVIGVIRMHDFNAQVLESAYKDMRNCDSRSGLKLSATCICEINETLGHKSPSATVVFFSQCCV